MDNKYKNLNSYIISKSLKINVQKVENSTSDGNFDKWAQTENKSDKSKMHLDARDRYEIERKQKIVKN